MDIDVGAAVKIGVTTDDLANTEKNIAGMFAGSARPKPIYNLRNGVAVSNGTALMTIDIGAAPIGSMWKLTSISTFGSDGHTIVLDNSSAALTASLYCGDPGFPTLTQLAVPGVKFPDYEEFQQEVIVMPNQNVFMQTNQPCPTGQQVGFVVRFEEWRLTDVSRNTGRMTHSG